MFSRTIKIPAARQKVTKVAPFSAKSLLAWSDQKIMTHRRAGTDLTLAVFWDCEASHLRVAPMSINLEVHLLSSLVEELQQRLTIKILWCAQVATQVCKANCWASSNSSVNFLRVCQTSLIQMRHENTTKTSKSVTCATKLSIWLIWWDIASDAAKPFAMRALQLSAVWPKILAHQLISSECATAVIR